MNRLVLMENVVHLTIVLARSDGKVPTVTFAYLCLDVNMAHVLTIVQAHPNPKPWNVSVMKAGLEAIVTSVSICLHKRLYPTIIF